MGLFCLYDYSQCSFFIDRCLRHARLCVCRRMTDTQLSPRCVPCRQMSHSCRVPSTVIVFRSNRRRHMPHPFHLTDLSISLIPVSSRHPQKFWAYQQLHQTSRHQKISAVCMEWNCISNARRHRQCLRRLVEHIHIQLCIDSEWLSSRLLAFQYNKPTAYE